MVSVGIDIGGTKLLGVLLDGSKVVEKLTLATPSDSDALAQTVSDVVSKFGGADSVGIGIAGLVLFPQGVFAWGPHVAGTRLPLRDQIEEILGLPAVVDSDANTAAYGELKVGNGRGYANMLLVTLGTGIGGAIVIDGKVYRGDSFAGEWGHMLYEPDGRQCACGKRGCWETVASGPALVFIAKTFVEANPAGSLAHLLSGSEITGEAVVQAADAGDEVARGLVTQVGLGFGLGLCNLIAIFDPQIIVVGGGLGSIGESILGPARRVAADRLHGAAHRMLPPILVAGLGQEAGAIGAGLMAAAAAKDGIESI
ncbi:MAG: ROK family protein [Acidobacteria bacterium]|nr:ROK family protein [Acidobacteriota bacterium]